MKRPTDKYNDPGPRTLRMLLVRGGLLLVLAAVIGTLAGWTEGCARHRLRPDRRTRGSPHAGSEAWAISSRPPTARWT